MTAVGSASVTSVSPTVIDPPVGRRIPERTSTSSVWPLPDTPATPTISPAATSSETSVSAGSPWVPVAWRSRMRRIGSWAARPASAGRSTPKLGRPTIIRASSRSSVWPSTVPTSAPRRSTVIRWLMARTSASLWLMNTTAMPSPTSRRRVANRAWTSSGTRTAVGSSRIRMRHSRERALRISTRCCSPTDRSATRAAGSTRMPKRVDASSAWRRAALRSSRSVLARPRTRFSATVMGRTRAKCWVTMPTPASIASRGERMARTSSPTRIWPESGWVSPYAIRMAVVFPAPFSPSRAWTSPARTSKSIRSLARRSPKRLVMPRSASAGAPGETGGAPSGAPPTLIFEPLADR